ncbi:MAG: dephospho-CoA kinase [Clostridia bacterium]|nr:dephospho-CoA kinase [Clostridia bacterium]
MFILGVTGGIGSGKSTVSSILRERGVLVLDADEISRKVTEADGLAIESIREAFGNRAIGPDNALNRKYMASVVFNDNTKLDLLSSIIHRYVFEYMNKVIDEERNKGTKAIVLDVPIPVKNGFVSACNRIWVVTCDEEVRIQRLLKRGMTEDDARRRISVQMTDDEYLAIGNCEIDNSGTLDELETRVQELIEEDFLSRGIRI